METCSDIGTFRHNCFKLLYHKSDGWLCYLRNSFDWKYFLCSLCKSATQWSIGALRSGFRPPIVALLVSIRIASCQWKHIIWTADNLFKCHNSIHWSDEGVSCHQVFMDYLTSLQRGLVRWKLPWMYYSPLSRLRNEERMFFGALVIHFYPWTRISGYTLLLLNNNAFVTRVMRTIFNRVKNKGLSVYI